VNVAEATLEKQGCKIQGTQVKFRTSLSGKIQICTTII
jgi:hypothetical protein